MRGIRNMWGEFLLVFKTGLIVYDKTFEFVCAACCDLKRFNGLKTYIKCWYQSFGLNKSVFCFDESNKTFNV